MLAAYLGATCISPGDRVDAMVSTDASHVNARVVRLIHGDPNPEGPGAVEEDALWPGIGVQTGGQQPLLTRLLARTALESQRPPIAHPGVLGLLDRSFTG
jgi:hypothetical protein